MGQAEPNEKRTYRFGQIIKPEDMTPEIKKNAWKGNLFGVIFLIVTVGLILNIVSNSSPSYSSSYSSKPKKTNTQTSSYSQSIADTYGISEDTVNSVLDAMTNELNKGK